MLEHSGEILHTLKSFLRMAAILFSVVMPATNATEPSVS